MRNLNYLFKLLPFIGIILSSICICYCLYYMFINLYLVVLVIHINPINKSSLNIKRGNTIRQDTQGRELLLSRLGLDARSPP